MEAPRQSLQYLHPAASQILSTGLSLEQRGVFGGDQVAAIVFSRC